MADRPVSAPRYRLLERGEVMQRGDQSLDEDAETWNDLTPIGFGLQYNSAFFMPIRRPLTPTPYKEQTE